MENAGMRAPVFEIEKMEENHVAEHGFFSSRILPEARQVFSVGISEGEIAHYPPIFRLTPLV